MVRTAAQDLLHLPENPAGQHHEGGAGGDLQEVPRLPQSLPLRPGAGQEVAEEGVGDVQGEHQGAGDLLQLEQHEDPGMRTLLLGEQAALPED